MSDENAHEALRGHPIEWDGQEYVYADTGEPTVGNRRSCGHCGLPDTPEGHDGCLGTLPGVMNACCGHGRPDEAYVQFPGGETGGPGVLDNILRGLDDPAKA